MAKKKTKAATGKTQVLSIRVPETLMPRLDDYVSKLREKNPGGNWSRSSAALNLVVLGLGQPCHTL